MHLNIYIWILTPIHNWIFAQATTCQCSRRDSESEGGKEEDEDEEESSGWERAIGSKSRKSNGAGGVDEEEEEGSKRCRRIGVRGGPVEGEREEEGEVTLTQYKLTMQQLIVPDRHDPTASLPSFLARVKIAFIIAQKEIM